MSRPTHTAYVVEEAKKAGQKDYWHKIAPVWPHKDSEGLDVVIPAGLSVSGRLVIRSNKNEIRSDVEEEIEAISI